MFVSDAHLFVPKQIRWSPILAIRASSARRRKSLMRRLKRDLRIVLPVAALAVTFALTVAVVEIAAMAGPTSAQQSPMTALQRTTLAMLD